MNNMMNKFKLSDKIDLDGFTSATAWIEDNLKMIDGYYETQKQEGKLKKSVINHLETGRLITLGSAMEEIQPSDFNSKKEYDKTITNLYRNFFAYNIIPTLKDDILKTSDIRIIPVLGEIFGYRPIYASKDPHKYDEICVTGEKLEDIIPIEEVFNYISPSIEFDISGKLSSFFFGQDHTINKNIIYGKLTGYKNYSQSEILKKDKCLKVGVSYIKTVLGEEYFQQLIKESLNKLEDGIYVRLLDNLLPRNATNHEVVFEGLLERLIPYIDDENFKDEVQLEILLN